MTTYLIYHFYPRFLPVKLLLQVNEQFWRRTFLIWVARLFAGCYQVPDWEHSVTVKTSYWKHHTDVIQQLDRDVLKNWEHHAVAIQGKIIYTIYTYNIYNIYTITPGQLRTCQIGYIHTFTHLYLNHWYSVLYLRRWGLLN